jgi:nicotinate phosphoribosyltransferase
MGREGELFAGKPNLAMLCDFYEFTMSGGYLRQGMQDVVTHFDLFFRRVPDGGGFAIAAGLEPFIRYLEDLHFTHARTSRMAARQGLVRRGVPFLSGDLPVHR